MSKLSKPSLIIGTKSISKNGSIQFVNDFTFKKIKRFYHIMLPDINLIRAFHGHFIEEKYAYVIQGAILLCAIRLDDRQNPGKNAQIYTFKLNSHTPQIVHIPNGFANGMKALKKNSEIIFFSTLSLANSLKDDYRYPSDYWGIEIWKNK